MISQLCAIRTVCRVLIETQDVNWRISSNHI